jgi:diguanylate cyclase (GGDEF)-like protein
MSDAEKIKARQQLTRQHLRRNSWLSWLISTLLILAMAVVVLYDEQRVAKISVAIEKQGNVIDTLNNVHMNILDLETVERGYVITGNPAYLENQRAMRLMDVSMKNLFDAMRDLSSDMPIQLGELAQHVERKRVISSANIAARKNKFSDAMARVNAGSGKREMDIIRSLLDSLDDQQHQSRDKLRKQRDDTMQDLWQSLIGVSVFLLLTMYYLYLRNQFLLSSQRSTDMLIHHLATYDALTGLPNRQMLLDEMEHTLSRAQLSNKQIALLFLDLNGFKKVNDTLGHSVGDELLVQAAKRLQELIRGSDLVARLGGDEFVIVLESIAMMEDVQAIMNKVSREISRPFVLGQNTVDISTSIGLALYPRDGEDAGTLMRYADEVMYEAKRARQKRD